MFKHVIRRRSDGEGLIATTLRSWLRHASLDTRLPLIRYCYDSPYGETAAVWQTHLSNGIASLVTGGRPQWPCRIACLNRKWDTIVTIPHAIVTIPRLIACPNRKCDTIVTNAHAIVTNAHYCVQRPLLCSTPSIVFNAHRGSQHNDMAISWETHY